LHCRAPGMRCGPAPQPGEIGDGRIDGQPTMARELHTARLTQKICISESAQCFHLEFVVEGRDQFAFTPGQFVSLVREDPRSKLQTRAYSIASAPRANAFDLCVNRVEGGFFSNLLADMEPGETVSFHGPHGLFTLRQPL